VRRLGAGARVAAPGVGSRPYPGDVGAEFEAPTRFSGLFAGVVLNAVDVKGAPDLAAARGRGAEALYDEQARVERTFEAVLERAEEPDGKRCATPEGWDPLSAAIRGRWSHPAARGSRRGPAGDHGRQTRCGVGWSAKGSIRMAKVATVSTAEGSHLSAPHHNYTNV
jgi:hypothetical protein